MLEIRNLKLDLDNKTIFEGIDFDLEPGKISLLTGYSGVGKSALLMTVSGVIPNTIEGEISGSIKIDDEEISGLPTEKIAGKLAYISQDAESQLCSFTVEDEIIFTLENFNTPVEEIESKVDEILSNMNIMKLKYRNINELSGGEKQKVAIASLLVVNPDIIFLDEPTANLDPQSTEEIIEYINILNKKFNKTILIIEHKVKEFENIADKIYWMNKSEIKEVEKESFIKEYSEKIKLPELKREKEFSEKVIEVSNLSYSYVPGMEVLDNLNFSIYKGEILGITGYNGAGKSTLTKLLMGLIKPDTGKITVEDKDIKELQPKDIGQFMGLVFQNPEHQFIKMSVREELELSLKINGKDEDYIREKTEEYLDMFDLKNIERSNPFSISQGQKRRLSTASMMINGQRILLLDEPTYGQDRLNLKNLVNLLFEINEEGTTIIIVTHDREMIFSCCDRILFLENHKIKYMGKADGFNEYEQQ